MSLLEDLKGFHKAIGGKAFGEIAYGWRQKSAGQAVSLQNEAIVWIQVALHRSPEVASLFRKRLEAKDQIIGIQPPKLLELTTKEEPLRTLWTSTFVESAPFSITPELQDPIVLDSEWLQKLETQLIRLAEASSPFESYRQELITRRIQERYGPDLPTQIETWQTIHGDLHWANVTEDCTLLDWEGWGIGPRYLDIAFLYEYSVACPPVCQILEEKFPFLWGTSDGLICLLFVSSELLRMIELYEDHPQLKTPLETLAQRVIQQMTQKP
ncbi:MAG: hypothetical protein K2P90_02995 [Holosporales bacterium]|nr:hypothetical protein [Holosporales bacterium]